LAVRASFVLVALVSGALLLACDGDSDGPDSTPTPAVTQSASPAAEATATLQPDSPVSATPVPGASPASPSAERATAAASEALLSWLGPVGNADALEVSSVEEMTWGNACLDLGHAGEACAEILVQGFRILFTLGQATYEVRSDATGDNLRWAPMVMILVKFEDASTNAISFSTDDGGTIVTQPVFGTQYGVDVDTLSPGDPVGIGIADAPQADHPLLVFLAPAQ